MGILGPFIWILIPLAAIFVGAFKEWLKFKEKQLELGQSAENLDSQVKALSEALAFSESEKESLLNRIQNLETIVTSQVWDVMHDDDKPITDKKLEIEAAKPQIELPPEEDKAAEKAEILARRLRV